MALSWRLAGMKIRFPTCMVVSVAIRASHNRKLDRIRNIMRAHDGPMMISEISQAMYPDVEGYHILLALEEAGAHIEYLYQHGHLSIANLKEFEAETNPAILYALRD